jgi:hypothetical protein
MVQSRHLPANIRARQITEADFDAVVDLLTRGFAARGRRYWERALAKLKSHPTPCDLPKYGYLLDSDGTAVGIVLRIFSTVPAAGGSRLRCNLSSWYVEPEFRSHASMLIRQAIKHKDVTYLNVSPALHTRSTVEAQGFRPYTTGQFVCAPALSGACGERKTRVFGIDRLPEAHYEPHELAVMLAHREHGCMSLWCESPRRAYPFMFMPRLVKSVLPCVQLVYCREMQDFVRMARPIGLYLAARGRPLAIVDALGPMPGLVGRYVDGKLPKYFKGSDRPSLGDLAFTEAAMFGL